MQTPFPIAKKTDPPNITNAMLVIPPQNVQEIEAAGCELLISTLDAGSFTFTDRKPGRHNIYISHSHLQVPPCCSRDTTGNDDSEGLTLESGPRRSIRYVCKSTYLLDDCRVLIVYGRGGSKSNCVKCL